MGLDKDALEAGLDAVAAREPLVAAALGRVGYPAPRLRPRGFETLLRTIVGQQVSVAAAASVWRRLEEHLGAPVTPSALLAASDEGLRACGLSRQKAGYARSLSELVAEGTLDLHALPDDDEVAIAQLTLIKGIGRWSAEIYLLFAEGRPDVWPAGDLAVQAALHRLLGLEARPSEAETRRLAEGWRPYRSSMAVFAWHAYAHPGL